MDLWVAFNTENHFFCEALLGGFYGPGLLQFLMELSDHLVLGLQGFFSLPFSSQILVWTRVILNLQPWFRCVVLTSILPSSLLIHPLGHCLSDPHVTHMEKQAASRSNLCIHSPCLWWSHVAAIYVSISKTHLFVFAVSSVSSLTIPCSVSQCLEFQHPSQF